MIRLRLRRVGSKGQPSYRIVVADSRSPRDGRFIEKIGFYNPRTEPATYEINEARALYWLGTGAQPSEAVAHILNKVGTTARYQRLRGGEDIGALVAEAQAEAEARTTTGRTRREEKPVARPSRKSKAAAQVEQSAAPEPAEEEVPQAEAE